METWATTWRLAVSRCKLIPTLALAIILARLSCMAEDNSVTASDGADKVVSLGFEADMNSQYVWRGIVFECNPVIQPTVWASARSVTLSVWNSHVPGRETGVGIGHEVDFTLTHEHDWRLVTSELEFGYYLYPGDDESPATGEFTVSFSCPVGFLNACTRHTFDILEYKGSYFGETSLSVECITAHGLNLETRVFTGWASAEFNEIYAGVSHSALNLAGLAASATFRIAGPLYVCPHVEAYFTLDRTIVEATQPHVTNVGLAIGVD